MNQPLEWHTEQRMVNDLVPLEINPRRISEARRMKMIESLQRFNLVDIPVVDFDNTVVSGHQRLRALQAIGRGEEVIDVRLPNRKLTERELKEYNVLANTHFGEFDEELFGEFFSDVDLEGLGLEEEDLFGAVVDEPEPVKLEVKEDDYEVPDVIVTDIVPGDLFEIGPHRLLCGDSTSANDVERLMGGEKADMVFADPDFSMDFTLVKDCYSNSLIFSKGIAFWVCADKQAVQLASNDFENFAKFFVQDFRNATLLANNQPMTRHVMICQFGKRSMNNLHDGFSTLLQIATDRINEIHKVTPMSKKVELPGAFISHYSDENEIVLDIFLHSGSTMVAAHQLNRRCFGLEIEPKYCQCVIDRMLKLDPTLKVTRNGQMFKNNFRNSLETSKLAID